jgi:hypothetical protein
MSYVCITMLRGLAVVDRAADATSIMPCEILEVIDGRTGGWTWASPAIR